MTAISFFHLVQKRLGWKQQKRGGERERGKREEEKGELVFGDGKRRGNTAQEDSFFLY